MQFDTLEQAKRNVSPYGEKRVLITDMPDGLPNPKTHAYGDRAFSDEVQLDSVLAEGADLVVRRAVHVDSKKRVEQSRKNNYARVVRKVVKLYRTRRDLNGETIDDDMD